MQIHRTRACIFVGSGLVLLEFMSDIQTFTKVWSLFECCNFDGINQKVFFFFIVTKSYLML